jgi:pilus assembly protein CpaB
MKTLIGLLVLGVLAALSAAVLIGVLRAQQAEPGPRADVSPVRPDTVEIALAARDLEAMRTVTADGVEMKTVPIEEMPQGAMRSAQAVIGQVLAAPLMEGEAFTRGAFVQRGSGVHLATVLEPGTRAMSVELQSHTMLEGLLYPGSYVDVIASFRAPTPDPDDEEQQELQESLLSTVLLESIRVLAVEDKTVVSREEVEERSEEARQRTTTRRRIVTLQVDAKQAEFLQLASAHGSISLTLRNPLDPTRSADRGTLITDISPFLIPRSTDVLGRRPLREPVASSPIASAATDPGSNGMPAINGAGDPQVQPTQPRQQPRDMWSVDVYRGSRLETVRGEKK